jgi:dTDP-4-dehydrorhamnose reductase
MRVLVFGASGMIGSAMFRVLSQRHDWQVWGTLRAGSDRLFFKDGLKERLICGVDVDSQDALTRAFAHAQPDVVVNCIGLTKHHKESDDARLSIPLNALLPHRMADLCALARARLVHVSTDCVFAGTKGNYVESDASDAIDVYGKTKFLGEVDYPHAITLRTSTIGHELRSAFGLLEWFLSQKGKCKGFRRAIFSGLPNTVFAEIVRDVVIPRPDLRGLYHVGGPSIDKHSLLSLIAAEYKRQIDVVPDDSFVIDRSFSSERFRKATGHVPDAWPALIKAMHTSHQSSGAPHVQQ